MIAWKKQKYCISVLLEENDEDVYSHFGLTQVYMAREQYKEAKEYILGLEKQIEKSQDFLMNAGMVLWDAEIELGGNEEWFKSSTI